MIHIRIDDSPNNSDRRFACGIGPELPPGDTYFFAGEAGASRSDCPGCNPRGIGTLGTPLSELSGPPGSRSNAEFCRIAESQPSPYIRVYSRSPSVITRSDRGPSSAHGDRSSIRPRVSPISSAWNDTPLIE